MVGKQGDGCLSLVNGPLLSQFFDSSGCLQAPLSMPLVMPFLKMDSNLFVSHVHRIIHKDMEAPSSPYLFRWIARIFGGPYLFTQRSFNRSVWLLHAVSFLFLLLYIYLLCSEEATHQLELENCRTLVLFVFYLHGSYCLLWPFGN